MNSSAATPNSKKRSFALRPRTLTTLLAGLALLAVGAGAAVGEAMHGDIQAAIPVTVAQALVVEKPQPLNFPPNRNFFSSTSDDLTKFSFALEMFRGESLTVVVPIVNRSSGHTVAELTIIAPDVPTVRPEVPGLVITVGNSGKINDVVRVSPNVWRFTAHADAEGLAAVPPDGLKITLTVAPTAMTGFFEMTGRIKTHEF